MVEYALLKVTRFPANVLQPMRVVAVKFESLRQHLTIHAVNHPVEMVERVFRPAFVCFYLF